MTRLCHYRTEILEPFSSFYDRYNLKKVVKSKLQYYLFNLILAAVTLDYPNGIFFITQ